MKLKYVLYLFTAIILLTSTFSLAQEQSSIQLVKLYTDSNGETHFSDYEIDLSSHNAPPDAPGLGLSKPFLSQGAVFLNLPVGFYRGMNPSPARGFIFVLSGTLEVTVSSGDKKIFKAGDVFLEEDTTGGGHSGKVIGDENVNLVFVRLDQK